MMVAGVNGKIGVNAPRAVVEEQRPERENVIILPQPTVVYRVRGKPLKRSLVTMTNVS